jgi:hypothetical protein
LRYVLCFSSANSSAKIANIKPDLDEASPLFTLQHMHTDILAFANKKLIPQCKPL